MKEKLVPISILKNVTTVNVCSFWDMSQHSDIHLYNSVTISPAYDSGSHLPRLGTCQHVPSARAP